MCTIQFTPLNRFHSNLPHYFCFGLISKYTLQFKTTKAGCWPIFEIIFKPTFMLNTHHISFLEKKPSTISCCNVEAAARE